ncbi:hypothetical protein TPR58_20590 [Sphingomonas sp. HF-S3]|uniref:Uncharacterized protein n=1 Tax=Sphingomonas rustica TaxID=3103142 RepID=A0ABV0BDG2_9SPHN
MPMILSLLALLAAPPEPAPPRTYLLSIVEVPLKNDQALSGFAIETWGVRFEAVCHFPSGWTLRAGSRATPDGVLEGNGSHGATWLSPGSTAVLDDLVLVTLDGPLDAGSPDVRPPTFAGSFAIELPDDEEPTPVRLTLANIRLTPATACPAR